MRSSAWLNEAAAHVATQGQRVRALAYRTGGVAGQVARLGQLAALALQPLPGRFQVAHAADRVSTASALRACSLLASMVSCSCFSSPSMRSMRCALPPPALLALQLAGQFGHRAMGLVQRPLRVFALLFGGLQLLSEAGQLFFQFGLAVLQLLDLLTQF
jgi:hypothetical protein